MSTIHAFNTKRRYTANGQRIAWTLLSTGNVAMVDIDRGIDYILVHDQCFPATNRGVLALYDANKSAPWNEAEYKEAKTIEPALYAAARAVQS
jgi:hypothetical protein